MCICSRPVVGLCWWNAAGTRGGLAVTSTECFTLPRPPDMGVGWLGPAYIKDKELKAFRTPNKHTLQVQIRSKARKFASNDSGSGAKQDTSGYLVSDGRLQPRHFCERT